MNTRHKKYESKGTRCLPANRQKNVNTRPPKFYEPANRAACSANASGGEALRPPPEPPSSYFLLGLPPLQGQPTPAWNVSTSNWNHRKRINSQKISAPGDNQYSWKWLEFSRNCLCLWFPFFFFVQVSDDVSMMYAWYIHGIHGVQILSLAHFSLSPKLPRCYGSYVSLVVAAPVRRRLSRPW